MYRFVSNLGKLFEENKSLVRKSKTKIQTTCIIWDTSSIKLGDSNNRSKKPKVKNKNIKIKYDKGFFCSISVLNSFREINPKIRINAKKDSLFCAAKINTLANNTPEIDLFINSFKTKL